MMNLASSCERRNIAVLSNEMDSAIRETGHISDEIKPWLES
jgi:hypothetical protein